MKKYNLVTLVFLITLSSQIIASDMTIPNSFSANTPAVAADVNDNFTAAKTAIDDNHAKINNNGTNIGNLGSNLVTVINRSIRNESDTNTLTILTDRMKMGIQTINGSHCRSANPDQATSAYTCKLTNSTSTRHYTGVFYLNIPNGAKITNFKAYTMHSLGNAVSCNMYLRGVRGDGPFQTMMSISSDTTDDSVQVLSEPLDYLVNNDAYVYFVHCSTNSSHSDARVNNISIAYEY